MEFPEGWGKGVEKNPFLGEGMNIFWNYTMALQRSISKSSDNFYSQFCKSLKLTINNIYYKPIFPF